MDLRTRLMPLVIIPAFVLASCQTGQKSSAPEQTKVVVEPGEQAPLMDEGQKNFGQFGCYISTRLYTSLL